MTSARWTPLMRLATSLVEVDAMPRVEISDLNVGRVRAAMLPGPLPGDFAGAGRGEDERAGDNVWCDRRLKVINLKKP